MPEPDAVHLAAVCKDVQRPERGQNAICPLTFRKYRLSRAKIDWGSEPSKVSKLKRVGGRPAEQGREESARHPPPQLSTSWTLLWKDAPAASR
jgi:hypothetical protein